MRYIVGSAAIHKPHNRSSGHQTEGHTLLMGIHSSLNVIIWDHRVFKQCARAAVNNSHLATQNRMLNKVTY